MRSKPTHSARSVKTNYLVAAALPALIVVLSITGFVWAQKQVTVVVDGRMTHVVTQAPTVAALLRNARIIYGPGDVITPSPDAPLGTGMTVVVRHATAVTIDLGSEVLDMHVVGTSVADALVAVGVDPAADPAVTPPPSAPLSDGMRITVPRVFTRVSGTHVAIPFRRQTRFDPHLRRGERRIVSKGRPGDRLRLYRTLVCNGIEAPAILAAEATVTAPVAEIVAVGPTGRYSAIVAAARHLARVRSLKAPAPGTGRVMRVEATGYAPGSGGADHTCATGARATHGVIAVDPRVIPLGTRVFVPGYGYAVAADTGGAIKGHRIDVCYDSYAEAMRWGRRSMTIVILDWP